MAHYLMPLQLFWESTKQPRAVILGLSFSDKYVSLAISDRGHFTSPFYCKCPRDESLLDHLLGYVQSLQKDFGYRLEGIVVANSGSVGPREFIRNLMDNLCEKGQFETSYTCWEHNLTYSVTQIAYSAQYMLQAFVHHCNTFLVRGREFRGREERREEQECMICHHGIEHKIVRYPERLQLIRKSISLYLGLSFSDDRVSLVIYDGSDLIAPFSRKFPIDDSLLDELVDFVLRQRDDGYDLEEIFVAFEHSCSMVPTLVNIDNLMEGLCRKGKFASLKYTFWGDDLALELFLELFYFQFKDRIYTEGLDFIRMEQGKIWHTSDEHKMVRYLEPLQLFRECKKRNHHMPSSVFLGLSFTDDYVSLAMSDDCYLTARFYDGYPMNDSLAEKLLDVFQMLNTDFEYDLEGIIVDYNSSTVSPEIICTLLENLCEKAKFANLKYTFWEDDTALEGVEFECNKFGSWFWGITFPVDPVIQKAYDKTFSAQDMLRAFLHSFNTLHRDKDRVEWEDFKREKMCKICHNGAEHKMVQYLEPLQLFRESMKRTYYMPPAVFLGLSISDKNVSLAVSDHHYSDACYYGIYPIDDKSLLEKLLDSVLRLKRERHYDLLGIVVANRSSKENLSSLEIDGHMDHLCKKGNFKSLKYTRWVDDIASRSSLFEYYGSKSNMFPRDCSSGSEWKTFPVDCSRLCSDRQEYFEKTSAKYMLEAFLNVFETLHMNKELRERRGWISRGKEVVQDAPQQSRAPDDRELEANEMEDSKEEMEDTDEGKPTRRWRIQRRRWRIQRRRWRIQTKG